MLFLRKILCTYYMNDPPWISKWLSCFSIIINTRVVASPQWAGGGAKIGGLNKVSRWRRREDVFLFQSFLLKFLQKIWKIKNVLFILQLWYFSSTFRRDRLLSFWLLWSHGWLYQIFINRVIPPHLLYKKCRNVLVLSSITLNKFLPVRWDLFLKLAIFDSPLGLFYIKFFQLVAFVEEY